jgi:hypothetical protein
LCVRASNALSAPPAKAMAKAVRSWYIMEVFIALEISRGGGAVMIRADSRAMFVC